jgi:DNA polymerase-3 subunit chi
MQIDFYQLAGVPPDTVVAQLAGKTVESGKRLLIVAESDEQLIRLDQALWIEDAGSFLPHGLAGAGNEASQPILLASQPAALNSATYIMLADGIWRKEALQFERALYLFDEASLEAARQAWKTLAEQDGAETRYWKNDGGRWRQGP